MARAVRRASGLTVDGPRRSGDRLGWTPSGTDWSLTSLPNVLLPALVLLATGAGAFVVQRRHRTRA